MRRENVSGILFTHVVLLDEQMRQHDDIAYCSLLRRLRMGHTTMGNYMTLIGEVGDGVSTVIPTGGSSAKVIVRSNQLRQHNPGNNQFIFLWHPIIQLTLQFILKNSDR